MPLQLSRIQALCFDVDGTLCDTDDMYVQRFTRLLQPLRGLFPRRDAGVLARRLVMWAEAPGNYVIGIPDKFGWDDEIYRLLEWAERWHPRPLKNFLIIPDVKEMLQTLHARYPMAVVSARDEKSTRRFLDQFDLTPLFQVIVTAQTAKRTKPYPDPVLFAAQAMNVPAENCLMIGDTTVDIRAGRGAGAQTVGVLCGFGEQRELQRQGADLILASTADLAQTLAPE